jgi:lipopolysaccharide export system protein LptA
MTNTTPRSEPGRTHLRKLALGYAIGGFALTAALAGGMTLHAQGIGGHNSNAPVNYAADRIELQDRENRVILSGNVQIDQAGLSLRAARTLVNFSDTGSLSIQRITATGGVEVTRGDERASGDNAIYDFNRRIITMAGNVRLRRGGDTLNGGRLVIDLNSGLSSVDGSASGSAGGGASGSGNGRVTGSFAVPQGRQPDPQ